MASERRRSRSTGSTPKESLAAWGEWWRGARVTGPTDYRGRVGSRHCGAPAGGCEDVACARTPDCRGLLRRTRSSIRRHAATMFAFWKSSQGFIDEGTTRRSVCFLSLRRPPTGSRSRWILHEPLFDNRGRPCPDLAVPKPGPCRSPRRVVHADPRDVGAILRPFLAESGWAWNDEAGEVAGVVALKYAGSTGPELEAETTNMAQEVVRRLRSELPAAILEASWADASSYALSAPLAQRQRDEGRSIVSLPASTENPLARPCEKCHQSPACRATSDGNRCRVDCAMRHAAAGNSTRLQAHSGRSSTNSPLRATSRPQSGSRST